MNTMAEKIPLLWPEIALLTGACVCMLMGLASSAAVRRLTVWAAALALIVAALLIRTPVGDSGYVETAAARLVRSVTGGEAGAGTLLSGLPATLGMSAYVKFWVAIVGLVLLLLAAAVPSRLRQTRQAEAAGRAFDPALTMRGEFFAFFLLSLTGVMLCAGATDLAWLFLSLELASLPTYVMVSISRERVQAQESGVKYFFLGAMAAAVFLYGFALLYGATGTTDLQVMHDMVQGEAGVVSPLLLTGLVISVIGISFKIAAAPMHFYAADVYQGAATPVTAFLAFVPKTAGFVSIILLLSVVGWPLPEPLAWLLWIMAAVTMTMGNVLGLLQSNVKRVLAYSSIAHSGYMLVGLLGASWSGAGREPLGNGVAAVLFYLVAYGFGTIAAFGVLACLERRGEEAQEYDDLSGLVRRHPGLAVIMLLAVLSLIGLPPLVGFMGKIYLFGSAIRHGFIVLVVIAVLNSAISAVYYLRIVATCFFGDTEEQTQRVPAQGAFIGAAIAAAASLTFGLLGNGLVLAARDASPPAEAARTAEAPPQVETLAAQD